MSVTITVASKKAPAEGKKQWQITDNTGKKWGVFPDKAEMFHEFATYEIMEYGTNVFNGRTFYTIKEARLIGPMAPPVNRSSEPKSFSPYMNTDDARRMDIFVCGAFNNILANQNVNPTSLSPEMMINIVHSLKKVWKAAQLGPGNPSINSLNNPDINDEIPE